MSDLGHPDIQRVARRALIRRTGGVAGTGAAAIAAQRAYDDLARVSVPLIGQIGMDALMGRTLFLLQSKYRWLGLTREPGEWAGPFTQIVFSLKAQTPSIGMEAAGSVFATLAGLIAAFIGEPLTMRLLQEAWPDAFTDANNEEQ